MPPPLDSPTEPDAPRVGRVFGGKYTIEAVIGAGGMATVYRGAHRNGNRVAIKVLRPELSILGDVRARFVREGYIANSIDHRGVVRVLDDDVADDGSVFLVMDLLEGETLGARARRRGDRLPCREVLALGREILDVLAAAHARGIVHRDIKPDNLFLTTGLEIKILDFGIARIDDDPGGLATRAGARLGTPAFMPPEQALGRRDEVDARTDLWAVGATMFTLLSGGFVHDAPTGEEMIIRTATQPSRSLADAAPDAPAAVIEVVNRALRFDRAERWSSASEMRDAVERAYESSYGEPLGPSALGPPPSRRNVASPGERSTVVGEGGADFAHDTTRPAFTSDGADAAGPTRAATATPVPPPLEEPTGSPTPAPIIAPRRPRRATPTLVLALAAIVGIGAFAAWRARPREPAPTTPRAVVRACSTNRECLASSAGKPAICRKEDGVCVALESPECQILAEPGDVENDATIWVGAMFPIRHPDPLHFGPMAQKAIELARRDFANTTGGLPPTRPGQPKRPLAVVLCDDHENAAAAAAHLASDVRVPAVIGFARSKEAFDLATNVFVPEGILVLASNTSSILRDIPRAPGKDEPRLAWRITTTLDMVVPPTAAVLSAVIEPAVRRAPGVLRPDEPVRVALVRVDSPTGQDLASSLLTALRFNGKSVAANGPSFLQLLTAETLDLPRAEETTRLVADLTRFAPHIIVSAGLRPEVILALERAWPATLSFRPRYLTDELLAVDIQSLVKERPEARKRLFAVNTRSDSEVLARFVVRYNEVFTPRKTATELNSAPYDGFYVFAYAAAALGDQPITGRALALSIPRLLPPGERVDVGPSGIFATVYALRDGKRVDLQGSVTTLDFNRDTGDATADFSMLCITPDAPGAPPVQIESGLTMRGGATKLEGELRCP